MPQSEDRITGEFGSPDLRQASAKIFDSGVADFGKGVYFADVVETPASMLSEMRNGKRTIPFHFVLALLQNRSSAKSIIHPLCRIAGFTMPALQTEIELSPGEARLLRFLMHAGAWRFVGGMIAREFYRVELDLLEVAIDMQERK